MRSNIIKLFIFLRLSGLLLSIFFIGGIIYYFKRLHIFQAWQKKWYSKVGVSTVEALANLGNKKWKQITTLLNDPYQSSWKLAVLRADGIIERTLNYIQVGGDTFEKHIEYLQKQGYRHLDIILQYHELGKNILADQNVQISHEQAQAICQTYQQFWQELIQYLGH